MISLIIYIILVTAAIIIQLNKKLWFIKKSKAKTNCFLLGIVAIYSFSLAFIVNSHIRPIPAWQIILAIIIVIFVSSWSFWTAFSSETN